MSDMRCPFCGKQMYHPVGKPTWSCQNWDCLKSEGMIGNHVLWQELIRTCKVLDKAKWWLNEIVESHRCTPISTAEMALKEITALEQKDVK